MSENDSAATELDTGADGNASSEVSQDATASTVGTSPDTGSAQAGTPADDGSASLKSETETKTQATDQVRTTQPAAGVPAAPAKPVEDWKKRHDGQFQANQRLTQERKQLDERLKALEQQYAPFQKVPQEELTQFLQAREKANLPVWNPQHQEHEGFRAALTKYELFNEIYDSETDPEVKTRLMQRFHQAVPQAMRQQIAAFQDHGRRERLRMEMDPERYIHDRVEKMVAQKITEFRDNTVGGYQQNLQAQHEVTTLMQKYPDIANDQAQLQKVSQYFQAGNPMNVAFLMVRNELLEGRVSGADTARKSVEEKERLLTQKASISRDPAMSTKVDLHAEAVKVMRQRSIPAGDPRYLDIQDELRRKYNIKG